MHVYFFVDMEEQGSTVAMDINIESPEIFSKGIVNVYNKLVDADFFNNFEDNFND
ncbi:hypothetical protein P3X46_002362 [Hevea brasiliensis]|uniref:Bet v I/Major latex protein domain-containing protein n=1 Tax=Hevea brasiliensis TaxID=3981 RepID=A0ABQ9N668_HEVBR|nr:hypothetical protein P3X46_002362 [Hevea brasiliensis]